MVEGLEQRMFGLSRPGSCLLIFVSPQIDGQAEVELKPAEGKEYAMDSESYLEVRDAAATRVSVRTCVALVSTLNPPGVQNSWCRD